MSTKPEEVSFLYPGPFDSDASCKEREPFNIVLYINCGEQASHVGLGVREGLGATLNYPVGDVFGGMK